MISPSEHDATSAPRALLRAVLASFLLAAVAAVSILAARWLGLVGVAIPSLLLGAGWEGASLSDISGHALWLLFRIYSLLLATSAVLTVLPPNMFGSHSSPESALRWQRIRRQVLLVVYSASLAALIVVLLWLLFYSRHYLITGLDWLRAKFATHISIYMSETLGVVLLTGPVILRGPTLVDRRRGNPIPDTLSGGGRPLLPTPLPLLACLVAIAIAWVFLLGCWDKDTILLHSIAACLGNTGEAVRLSQMDTDRVALLYRIGIGLPLGLAAMCLARELAPSRVARMLDTAVLPGLVASPRRLALWAVWGSACVVVPISALCFHLTPAELRAMPEELMHQLILGTFGFIAAHLLLGLCLLLTSGRREGNAKPGT